MRGAARTRLPVRPPSLRTCAAAWLEPGRALVVHRDDDGGHHATAFDVPLLAGATPPALAEVAHAIGAVDLVLVVGPEDLRTVLEREIVAIGHRPDIIRDVQPAGEADEERLLTLLDRYA